MTLPIRSSVRLASLSSAFAAFAFLAVVSVSSLKADTPALRPLADQAMIQPLTTSFEKSADADQGPYVLKVKNTSDKTVKATAKVVRSDVSHNDSKERNLSDHAIEAGQTWSIPNLAAGDKVSITADGITPLELTVP